MKTDPFTDLFDRSDLVAVFVQSLSIDAAPASKSLERIVSGEMFPCPLPELLFFLFPWRRDWYFEEWCRRGAVDAWAWDEARGLLNRMVAAGDPTPRCLSRFALVPRPPDRRGRKEKLERDVRLWFVLEGFLDEGCPVEDLWDIYKFAFPASPGVRDPRDSYRKLSARRWRWLDGPGDEQGDGLPDSEPEVCVVPPELPGDEAWVDPAATVGELLGGPPSISALALVRHFWPEHCCEHHVRFWCSLAAEHAWFWDELRGWLDWLIFSERDILSPLREFACCPRPKNPSNRPPEHASHLRAAVLAQRLEEMGFTEGKEVQVLVDGWPELVEQSTVRRHIKNGRDSFMDFLRIQLGASAIPFP